MADTTITALDISASALSAQTRRMNVIATNIANASSMLDPTTGEPYRRREVSFASEMKRAGDFAESPAERVGGVRVAAVTISDAPLQTVYDPTNKFANKEGFVQMPNVSVTQEMVEMVSAQREYEANLSAMKAYREILRNSLQIMKR